MTNDNHLEFRRAEAKQHVSSFVEGVNEDDFIGKLKK